jgi:hypothetical protein
MPKKKRGGGGGNERARNKQSRNAIKIDERRAYIIEQRGEEMDVDEMNSPDTISANPIIISTKTTIDPRDDGSDRSPSPVRARVQAPTTTNSDAMSPNRARQERKLRRRRVISNQEAKQLRESLRRGTTEIISTPNELMELLDQSQELDRDANYD